jgi:hypothetical protein
MPGGWAGGWECREAGGGPGWGQRCATLPPDACAEAEAEADAASRPPDPRFTPHPPAS